MPYLIFAGIVLAALGHVWWLNRQRSKEERL